MNSEAMPDAIASARVVANAPGDQADANADDAIALDSCAALDWIVVRTRNSAYDLIVLPGETGDVLVRGGRFFPEFRRATVAGSMLGGRAVKAGTICVGLHLELRVEGKSFVTSTIKAVSRRRPCIAEEKRWP